MWNTVLPFPHRGRFSEVQRWNASGKGTAALLESGKSLPFKAGGLTNSFGKDLPAQFGSGGSFSRLFLEVMRANQGSDTHASAPESQGQQRYCKEILAAAAASKNSFACCDQERPGVGPGHWFGSQCVHCSIALCCNKATGVMNIDEHEHHVNHEPEKMQRGARTWPRHGVLGLGADGMPLAMHSTHGPCPFAELGLSVVLQGETHASSK